MAHYDLIIQGGRYFDGSTAPSAIRSLAINDGRIVLISVEPLDTALAERIIDARGKWITPRLSRYPYPLRCRADGCPQPVGVGYIRLGDRADLAGR